MFFSWAFCISIWILATYGYVIDPELGLNPDTLLPNVEISGLAETGEICVNGTRQSPINIASCVRSTQPALKTKGYSDIRSGGFTLTNTGSSAQITYSGSDKATMTGGPLPTDSNYNFEQAHFHWGSTSAQGAEHGNFGNYGALEIHFVHIKSDYPDVATALPNEDGLAVFGIIFTLQTENNPALDKIIGLLANITAVNAQTTLDSDAMAWVGDVLSTFNYYNYPGSLTTGDCNEVVNWIVMKKTVGVSASQVAEFRKLLKTDGSANTQNTRPVQKLGSRVVQCARGCSPTPEP